MKKTLFPILTFTILGFHSFASDQERTQEQINQNIAKMLEVAYEPIGFIKLKWNRFMQNYEETIGRESADDLFCFQPSERFGISIMKGTQDPSWFLNGEHSRCNKYRESHYQNDSKFFRSEIYSSMIGSMKGDIKNYSRAYALAYHYYSMEKTYHKTADELKTVIDDSIKKLEEQSKQGSKLSPLEICLAMEFRSTVLTAQNSHVASEAYPRYGIENYDSKGRLLYKFLVGGKPGIRTHHFLGELEESDKHTREYESRVKKVAALTADWLLQTAADRRTCPSSFNVQVDTATLKRQVVELERQTSQIVTNEASPHQSSSSHGSVGLLKFLLGGYMFKQYVNSPTGN